MVDARLLIDSDAFVFLAGTGLLSEAIRVLGFTREQVLRLQALPHMLRRPGKFDKYSQEARHLASKECAVVAALGTSPSHRTLESLKNVIDIDLGDAVIIGLVAENPGWVALSGDRRCIVSLATRPEVWDIAQTVAGRIAYLEEVIRALLLERGPAALMSSVAPELESRISLKKTFTSSNLTVDGKCLAVLDAYLAEVTRSVGAGFLVAPRTTNASQTAPETGSSS